MDNKLNSGIWVDRAMTSTENQQLLWLPMDVITETIHYISDDNKSNQRFVVDVKSEHPDVWQLSKITRRSPFGTCKLGLYKHEWNPLTDYIEKDFNGNIIGMWADYNTTQTNIEDPATPLPEIPDDRKRYTFNLSASDNTLKIGGSYKTINLSILDTDSYDISEMFKDKSLTWSYYISDPFSEELTDITDSDLIKVLPSSFNKIKIKFSKDSSYLSKILNIKVSDGIVTGILQLELISL